jgi:hypothetical protein
VLTEVYTAVNGGEDVFFLRRGEVDRKEGKADPNFIQVLMRTSDSQKKWTGHPNQAAAETSAHRARQIG